MANELSLSCTKILLLPSDQENKGRKALEINIGWLIIACLRFDAHKKNWTVANVHKNLLKYKVACLERVIVHNNNFRFILFSNVLFGQQWMYLALMPSYGGKFICCWLVRTDIMSSWTKPMCFWCLRRGGYAIRKKNEFHWSVKSKHRIAADTVTAVRVSHQQVVFDQLSDYTRL